MRDPITIFLIVLGLFSVGLLLLLCFLPREVPLAFVVKLVWWYWILLNFACLESFWFLHQIWRRVLLSILGYRFFPFITLNISYHSLLVCRVSVQKSSDSLWEFPCMLFVIFPMLLSILYLWLQFLSVWLLCVSVCSSLGLAFLGFSVLPVLGWLFPLPCSGRFWLLSLQIFSQVLSLSLLLLGPLMWVLLPLMLSERSLRLFSFIFTLFSVFCSVAVISTILFSRWFICSSTSLILLDCF